MRYPELCCNLANKLPGNQRDLPTRTGGFGHAVVTLKPQIRDRPSAGLWLQGLPAPRSNANPFHTALPNRAEIPIQRVFALRHDQFPPIKDWGRFTGPTYLQIKTARLKEHNAGTAGEHRAQKQCEHRMFLSRCDH